MRTFAPKRLSWAGRRNIEYNGKQYTRYEINRERSQQMYGDPETYLYMDPLKKN